MYKTLRTGGFKIDKLIPNMVPFWTGFEMIDDGDALITYELPTTYHLTSGNQMISYELIITGITINCEKYPGLADDIDVREDILRRLARKLNNVLKGTFDEGEQIKVQIRKKHNVPSAYENMVDESVVGSEDKYLVNKIKLAFRVLKNGNASFDHPFYNSQTKTLQHRNVDFKYELPNHIRIHKNFGDTLNPFTIQVPEFKIESEKYSTLHNKSEIREKILRIIAGKLNKIVGTSIGVEERINIVFEKPHHNKNLTTPITIRESVVDDPIEQEKQIEKAKIVYKAFRKGTLKFKINDNLDGEHVIVAKYELPKVYKLKTSFLEEYMRNIGIIVNWKDIKCEIIEGPKNTRKPIIDYVLQMIKQRIERFEYNIVLHFDNQKPNDVKGGQIIALKEEKENEHETLVKKAPTVFKALKKGKITMEVDAIRLFYRGATDPQKYTFDYDLGDIYIVETDPFENNYNVKVLIPSIKINCDENPNLNNIQTIKMDILNIVKKKFNNFGLNIILRATKFRLKHNGTWVKL
jgi:hypothetical protein